MNQGPDDAASQGHEHPTFSVDTHLFRELGELLVGRDSTALVELIKNAYDADAREVVVYGEALEDRNRGYISIRDNGIGMSREEFELGFLRIASRSKNGGDRRSAYFSRRFTGEKGVGRLAAHKLARIVEVNSLRWDGKRDKTSALAARIGVVATINWELVEQYPTLDSVAGTDAITVQDTASPSPGRAGTTITLRGLRSSWTRAAHKRFLEELQTFGAAPVLVEALPKSTVKTPLLFESPLIRDTTDERGSVFSVQLEGELATPDNYWQAKADAASWVLEIDASATTNRVRYCIAPTVRTTEENPEARRVKFEVPHPHPADGPFFQARILLRTGKSWEGNANGIRVFVEGFRLLPYGEPRNDWLALDRDATARSDRLAPLVEDHPLNALLSPENAPRDVGLSALPNKHYFGAVFLTQESSRRLRTLVNREGFVPDAVYESLIDLVRGGVDLLTRTRAAASEKIRDQRRTERARKRESSPPSSSVLQGAITKARTLAQEARRLIASGSMSAAGEKLDEALRQIGEAEEASQDMIGQASMLRVLASVGTQMSAFIHEINGLVGTAEAVDHALRRLRRARGAGAPKAREQAELLNALGRVVSDLRRNLERQASYLVDVVTPDARRRRSKQKYAERFDAAARLVANVADAAGILIENGIPGTLQSPPMFPAELTVVFSNLLTNAVKAAGKGGRVRAAATRSDGKVEIRFENTGVAVDLQDAERWFDPFESTTAKVDAVLGQGMGLGLPITRSVLAEYGASIRFVRPRAGFASAIEIVVPT